MQGPVGRKGQSVVAGTPLDPDWFPVDPDDADDQAITHVVTVTEAETIVYRFPPPAIHASEE